MSRLTNDLGAVRLLFGPGILNLVNTVLVYATGVWLLLSLSPRLTLIALVPYPALVLGGRAFSKAMFHASRDLQDQLGKMSTSIQEDLAGISVVKHYGLEERSATGASACSTTSTWRGRCAWCGRAACWARCSPCSAARAR